MMLYPAMSELLKQVPSRYQLVNVGAARARKIAARAEREGLMLEEKPVSIAVQEIADGKLDESKTYALAGINYTLRNLGDGFAMFDGAELIKDYVSEDYLVMSTYAMTFGGVDAEGLPHLSSANSVLAEYPGYLLDYENPYGAGRISIL